MSCVLSPPDSGEDGKKIYEETGGCGPICHGKEAFSLFVRPGTVTLAEAQSRLQSGPVRRLEAIVAFGVAGQNADGVAFANMPPYHAKFSRPEILRVIDYIRTLPIEPSFYEIEGAKGGAPEPP